MTYYKVLNKDNRSCNGGNPDLVWSLPTQNPDGTWTPGEWMPEVVGKLKPCTNGYHLTEDIYLLEWLNDSIYEAEPSSEMVVGGDKIACRSVRLLKKMNWDDSIARLFACDCAERVLPLYEKQYPDDQRPRHAIEVARLLADGKATEAERKEAWEAAQGSVYVAELDVARASTPEGVYVAELAAARDAARAAARSVARTAAKNFAWLAAHDAAAWKVAIEAIGRKVWDEELEWQIGRLMWYLEGEKP